MHPASPSAPSTEPNRILPARSDARQGSRPAPDVVPVLLPAWRRAITKSDLPSKARHVALTLAERMDKAGGSCYPSVATVATETGMSERSVQTALRQLERAGYVVRTPPAKTGRPPKGAHYIDYLAHWQAAIPNPERVQEVHPSTRGKGAARDAERVQETTSERVQEVHPRLSALKGVSSKEDDDDDEIVVGEVSEELPPHLADAVAQVLRLASRRELSTEDHALVVRCYHEDAEGALSVLEEAGDRNARIRDRLPWLRRVLSNGDHAGRAAYLPRDQYGRPGAAPGTAERSLELAAAARPSCSTCNGMRAVDDPSGFGGWMPCPACLPRPCATCRGDRMVDVEGGMAPCPDCRASTQPGLMNVVT